MSRITLRLRLYLVTIFRAGSEEREGQARAAIIRTFDALIDYTAIHVTRPSLHRACLWSPLIQISC